MTKQDPFFETPPGDSTRRLLLISYHFPPSGTAGALRWQKLVALAADRGWAFDVITLDPTDLPHSDDAGLTDLPRGIRLYGVPAAQLSSQRIVTAVMAAVRRFRRGRHVTAPGIPPAERPNRAADVVASPRPGPVSRAYAATVLQAVERSWARAASELGISLAPREPYVAVITCGPPHGVHAAGAEVARRRRLPLIMDLRDPWRLVERLADPIDSPVWRWRAAWRERRLVPRASLIVMNTEPARDAMRERYPVFASKIIAVPNGFDEEPAPPTTRPDQFIITYTGSVYLDRDPRPLLEAVRRLIERRGLSPSDLGVMFVGNVESYQGVTIPQMARKVGVEPFVTTLPRRARPELATLLARSAMLVSLPQDSHMAVPSKLFEYMQYDACLLAMAEPLSATARLLAGSNADVVSAKDVEGLTAVLVTRYDQYRRGEFPLRLAVDARFSRRSHAERLWVALDGLVRERTRKTDEEGRH